MGLILFRALPCILALLVLTAGCARLHPPTPSDPSPFPPTTSGAIFLAEGQSLLLSDLADLPSSHDFILIGETHTNTCDHRFQKDALAALADSDRPLALGLEMVPWSAQKVLDTFSRGEMSLEELEEKLGWQDYWGFNFGMYSPVLAQARERGIPIYGLNIPKDTLQQVRLNGLESIPEDDRGMLPPTVIPPPPQQRKMIEQEFFRHQEMMPDRGSEAELGLERFILVQSLWDTQMAFSALHWQRATGRTMIILAGSVHVEYGHGISYRLRMLESTARILTLTPWRGTHPPDPTAADIFFHCPDNPQRLGLVLTWKDERALISSVLPGSLAEQAGLLPGDILTTANDMPISSMEILHRAGMEAVGTKQPLRLEVLRGDMLLNLNIVFP